MSVELQKFREIVARLRKECPWDKKQTHASLRRYLVEESHEVIEAIEAADQQALKEELGDVLLQVFLHSEIAEESGKFTIEDVAKSIAEKMVRRHPHVFDKKALSTKEHLARWTELKQKEKPKRMLLEGVPRSMPSLSVSQRYGEIASSVGFDWKSPKQVLAKLDEEIKELKAELKKGGKKRVEDELGDIFFTLANLARHLKLDAEAAARRGAAKFGDRFTRLEQSIKEENLVFKNLSSKELEKRWDEVKRLSSSSASKAGKRRRKG